MVRQVRWRWASKIALAEPDSMIRKLVSWRDADWTERQNSLGNHRITRPRAGRPVRWEDDISSYSRSKGVYWLGGEGASSREEWWFANAGHFIHR